MGTPAWRAPSKCIIPAALLVARRCVKNNIRAHFGECAGSEKMGHFFRAGTRQADLISDFTCLVTAEVE